MTKIYELHFFLQKEELILKLEKIEISRIKRLKVKRGVLIATLQKTSKADWVEPEATDKDVQFETGPGESLASWHERHGLVDP